MMHKKSILLVWLLVVVARSEDVCVEDFSPCVCTPFTVEENVVNVVCDQVAAEDIKDAFSRNSTTNLVRLFLTISQNASYLPSDLLGDSRAKEIGLTCIDRDFQLQVDRYAFTDSSKTVSRLEIKGCSIDQLEFSFLTNFTVLNEVDVTNSSFPALSDLPVLPHLRGLVITNCPSFTKWGEPNLSSVVEFWLNQNMLNDEDIDTILRSIPTANNSLKSLMLFGNNLTRIPEKLHLLNELTTLNLDGNTIPVIPTGSLAFSAPDFHYLRLEGLSLQFIEPEGLSGHFGAAVVQLNYNLLTQLDQSMFLSILEDMASVNSTGFLEIYLNPFECDCNISWLIRDNQHLMRRVEGGVCSNGTRFEDLDPDGFAYCDEVTESTDPSTSSTTSSTTSTTTSAPSASSTFHSFPILLMFFIACKQLIA